MAIGREICGAFLPPGVDVIGGLSVMSDSNFLNNNGASHASNPSTNCIGMYIAKGKCNVEARHVEQAQGKAAIRTAIFDK